MVSYLFGIRKGIFPNPVQSVVFVPAVTGEVCPVGGIQIVDRSKAFSTPESKVCTNAGPEFQSFDKGKFSINIPDDFITPPKTLLDGKSCYRINNFEVT